MEIKKGKYRHFKGIIVEVLYTARHSENLEEFVVYKEISETEDFEKNPLWIRPSKMFIEKVDFNGKKVSRFEFLE